MGKILIPGSRPKARQVASGRGKILTLLAAVVTAVTLTACGSPASPATSSTSVTSPKPSSAATSSVVSSSTSIAATTPAPKPAETGAGGGQPPTGGGAGGAQPPPAGGGAGGAQPPAGGGAGAAKPPAPGGGTYTGVYPKPPGGIPANQTVGVVYKDAKAFNGYTLFAPVFSTVTYLIDIDGKLVHTWNSTYSPGQSVYLIEGGTLVRSTHISNAQGPAGGGVQKIAWDGTMLWDFKYLPDNVIPHHDIRPMPNGNVLLICWDIKSREESVAAGRNPALISEGKVWSEKIVEIKPDGKTGGTVVWEWKLWDHLIQSQDATKANFGVIAEHPELMDINFGMGGKADWIHVNSIDYNPKLDQIVLSCHEQSELWVIDHSTTTAEAATHSGGKAGKGGDLIYRWGNPKGYGAGTAADQKLFAPHNIHWIDPGLPGEGNILVFNNGNARTGGNYSSADEITPPVDAQGRYTLTKGAAYGPAAQTWIYKAKTPADFFADKTSSAQRLPNGNTLICHGPLGTFFEVTKEGDMVWEYISPVAGKTIIAQGAKMPSDPGGGTQNGSFRAIRFAASSAALKGLDLTAGKLVEDTASTAQAPPAGQAPPAPAKTPAAGQPAPGGGGGGRAGGGPPAPSITSITPDSGPAAGGTVVTIAGNGLGGPVGTVTFGGTAATGISQTGDPPSYVCTAPPHAAGAVDVAVTTGGGTEMKKGGFTYK